MAMLSVKRPTLTTILYTVSTRSSTRTLTSRATSYGLLLVRLIAGIVVAGVIFYELYLANPLPKHNSDRQGPGTTATISPLALLATTLEERTTRLWRSIVCVGIVWLIFRKAYTEESLLVIRGLGVQTSTSSSSYLWANSTRFIPTSSIQDMFIHEAFKGFEVRYYLGIVIEGEESVVVVFPSILPRRETLEEVWRGARACLYEPKT